MIIKVPKNRGLGRDREAEEMAAQWLRALVGLKEDPGSSPSGYMTAHNCNSSLRNYDTLLWPLRAMRARGKQTYKQANIHTHINKY